MSRVRMEWRRAPVALLQVDTPEQGACVKIEIWSDIVCPWCYIGKRRFEEALAGFEHRDEVEIIWRSFELDPQAPHEAHGDLDARLANKYGIPVEQARQMQAQITETAAGAGLAFRFDIARTGNTFTAHRLIHFAASAGLSGDLKERLMAAYFTEGEAISDAETLVRLACEVGLDAEKARRVVDGDAYAEAVRTDEQEASALGIRGVPFFVLDRTYGVSGAQPAEVLLDAMRTAWGERPALTMVAPEAAEVCDDDTCAV